MKCYRCEKPLKRKGWAFGSPPVDDDVFCIQCAKHISFYEVISAHGRPYSFKPCQPVSQPKGGEEDES